MQMRGRGSRAKVERLIFNQIMVSASMGEGRIKMGTLAGSRGNREVGVCGALF